MRKKIKQSQGKIGHLAREKSMREAWKKVDNGWDFIAFLVTYRNKEARNWFIRILVIIVVIMIIYPPVAVWLHDAIANKIKALFG